MKTLIFATAFLSIVANAHGIRDAEKSLLKNDVRTKTTVVTNTDGNPCLPEGKSYLVELQVKKASWNPETSKVVHNWETVKTIGVDKQGRVMEVCAE